MSSQSGDIDIYFINLIYIIICIICSHVFLRLPVHPCIRVILCAIRLTIPPLTALISAALRDSARVLPPPPPSKQLSVWLVVQAGAALWSYSVSLSRPGRAPSWLHRSLREFSAGRHLQEKEREGICIACFLDCTLFISLSCGLSEMSPFLTPIVMNPGLFFTLWSESLMID